MIPIEIEVALASDPTTVVDVIQARMDPTYMEELRGPGGGDVTISLLDPKVRNNPLLIAWRNVLRFKVDGKVVGAMVVGKKSTRVIDADADGEFYKISGEGPRFWFGDTAVHPAGGIKKDSFEERFFNFATEQGLWYNPASWVTPTIVQSWGDVATSPWRYAPVDWPDAPAAKWVWSSNSTVSAPIGDNFFRYEFNLPALTKVAIFYTGDNEVSAYVDGELKEQTEPGAAKAWTAMNRIDIDLAAGPHVFAARVTNTGGPAAFIAAVFSYGDPVVPSSAQLLGYTGQPLLSSLQAAYNTSVQALNTALADLAATTPGTPANTSAKAVVATRRSQRDAALAALSSGTLRGSWTVNAYPTQPPGWSPGEIILTLMDEASARGVRFPNWVKPTFTASRDSYGAAWDRSLDWSFEVGTSLAEVIEKLEELVCDAWIDPDTYAFNMVAERGVDRSVYVYQNDGVTVKSSPLVFEKGKNLKKANTDGVAEIKNSLLVQTSEGWMARQDSASLATYGALEAKLETGVSEALSGHVADIVFLQKSTAEEGASYEIVPTPGHIPFVDFQVGDWVLAPNEVGLGVKRRVMSIGVEEDEAGNPTYSVEFDTIFKDNENKISRWLEKMGGGSLGGQFANSSGGQGAPIGVPVITTPGQQLTLIPQKPLNLDATSTGLWSVTGIEAFAEVHLTWDPVTANTDGSATVPQFYEVWQRTSEGSNVTYQRSAIVTTNEAYIRPFQTGSEWVFKVRALNTVDTIGEWSSEVTEVMAGPNAPMLAPTAPTVASSRGVVLVGWDGKLTDGSTPADPPPQFRYIYVLVATSSGGVYSRMGATIARDGRSISIPGLTVGNTYWFKLRAVDGIGVQSAISAATSHTVTGIDLGDLDESVGDAIDAAQQAAAEARGATNMLADPSFEANDPTIWSRENPDVTNSNSVSRTGSRSMRVRAQADPYIASRYSRIFPVQGNDSFYLSFWARALTTVEVDDGLAFGLEYGPTEALGSYVDIASTPDNLDTNWQFMEGHFMLPSTARYVRPVFKANGSADDVYFIDDATMRFQIPNALVVDGAISADKIAAAAVVAGKIAADAIAAENIQAGAVTAGKIQAGSITAGDIAARGISADNIDVGAIQTIHISSEVGQELDISSNDSVNIIVGRVDQVTDDLNDTSASLETMQTYYQFGPTGAIISSPASPFSVAIRNDRIEMLELSVPVSYWNSGQMFVRSVVIEEANLGNHKIEKYGSGTVVRAL